MAQLVKIGNFLVEIDGTKLTFFDAAGNPTGQPQDIAQASQVLLPDGAPLAIEDLTELLSDEALSGFQTAAGGEQPAAAEIDSGGGRFASFEGQQGLGGLASIGGLEGTDLSYETINRVERRIDDNQEPAPSLTGLFDEQPAAPVLLAPEVKATGGSVDLAITKISGNQNPLGDLKVGDYLSSGGVNGKAVNPAMVNGVDSKNLTMSEAAEIKVAFVSEGAGYKSMVGFYTFDADGSVNPDSLQFLWLDASQGKQNTPGGALNKDFLGNAQPQEISLGQLPADTKFGFFIVADGASKAANQKLLNSINGVDKAGNNHATDLAAINQHLGFKVDGNGNGVVTVAGQALSGHIYFTHDKTLNTDANKNDLEHTLSGVTAKNDGKLYIGFEDLAGGGDRDYDDVVISVDIGQYNINKLSQSVTQPTVQLSDADSSHLASLIITTHGFDASDSLNLPVNALFDVTKQTIGSDVVVTVTAKSGAETIAVFEDFANQVYFSTSGTVEGERQISYQAMDTDGNVSNIDTVSVGVNVGYDISDSELGSLAKLGSGDDVLHLTTQSLAKPIDLGDGHDTVRLEKTGMTFGSAEAQTIKNAEVLDAKGAGNNKVSLSFEDVIDMTDGANHLTILGQQGDSLNLTGDGAGHHWSVVDKGAEFTTYAYDDGINQAMVEVSNQMAQTVI